MKNFHQTTFLFLLIFVISLSLYSQENINSSIDYTYKKGDFNGIRKWYLGREIAYVMGYEGINWLERSSREKEENTTALIQNMNIKTTDNIADIGAGSGYHVFKMAPLNTKGVVYAVDIQTEMLNAILKNPKFEKHTNIELIQGDEKSVNLPENTFDKILMVDVYHEFNYPKEIILSIKKALKDTGKIYLIEYRLEDDSVPIKKLHKMSEKQAVKEFNAAEFRLDTNRTNLPWQHCMVFRKQ